MSPKQKLLAEPHAAEEYLRTVSQAGIQPALDLAMLQFVAESSAVDHESAASAYWRLQGVKDFIRIFLTLGDQQMPRKPLPDINLKHLP